MLTNVAPSWTSSPTGSTHPPPSANSRYRVRWSPEMPRSVHGRLTSDSVPVVVVVAGVAVEGTGPLAVTGSVFELDNDRSDPTVSNGPPLGDSGAAQPARPSAMHKAAAPAAERGTPDIRLMVRPFPSTPRIAKHSSPRQASTGHTVSPAPVPVSRRRLRTDP